MTIVEYHSNNSGGSWWLKDKDWLALEAAGWKVQWAHLENMYDENGDYQRDDEGFPVFVPLGEGNSKYKSFSALSKKPGADGKMRYMGALANYAHRKTDNPVETIREFERVTGQDTTDEGCNCCGAPHCFTWTDEGGNQYASGESIIPLLYGENAPKSLREALERSNGVG